MSRHDVVPVPSGCGFDGWYFEDGRFCSPAGDRLSKPAVLATVMYVQTEAVRDLMYWRPSRISTDLVMHNFIDSPRPHHLRTDLTPFSVRDLVYQESRL